MPTLVLLTLATVALASVTAYFTVFGLAALAPQVPWAMIALGLSLEFAQYASVTFMYGNWKNMPRLLRYTMVVVLASVLTLNAVGVFGYLQSAFTPALTQTQQGTEQLQELTTRRTQLETELAQIDAETKRVPDNLVKARINLLREYEGRRENVSSELQTVRQDIRKLQSSLATVKAHTGPLTYVAAILGVPAEKAVTWMSILLTVSLEPLALLMSVGIVFLRQKKDRDSFADVPGLPIPRPSPPPRRTPVVESKTDPISEATEDAIRMFTEFPPKENLATVDHDSKAVSPVVDPQPPIVSDPGPDTIPVPQPTLSSATDDAGTEVVAIPIRDEPSGKWSVHRTRIPARENKS